MLCVPRQAVKGREDLVPAEALRRTWDHSNIVEVVQREDPDVILVCGWPVLNALPVGLFAVPVILDQAGPHLLERRYQEFSTEDANRTEKLQAFRKADFFTSSGERQHEYFTKWLAEAGWSVEDIQRRAHVIPFSMSPGASRPAALGRAHLRLRWRVSALARPYGRARDAGCRTRASRRRSPASVRRPPLLRLRARGPSLESLREARRQRPRRSARAPTVRCRDGLLLARACRTRLDGIQRGARACVHNAYGRVPVVRPSGHLQRLFGVERLHRRVRRGLDGGPDRRRRDPQCHQRDLRRSWRSSFARARTRVASCANAWTGRRRSSRSMRSRATRRCASRARS